MLSSPNQTENVYRGNNLLKIADLNIDEINHLLDLAEIYTKSPIDNDVINNRLKKFIQINLFFESSTRTQSSFELAGKRLGANVMNMAVKNSSISKGETVLDTATTLNAMHPDILVVRHDCAGAVELLAQKVECAVINAGDGAHEHPTQALLDALTIRRHKKSFSGLKVAICGDIMHSRVARSNMILLHKMGARVRIIAPSTLTPPAADRLGVEIFHNMEEGIRGCDIVMVLRLQMERMQGSYIPSVREYYKFFGLDEIKLKAAKQNVLVMHPGPMNRGIEIDSLVADGNRSLVSEQIEMGVAVRMAVLDTLCSNLHKKRKVRTKL